ncbi:MAG TPA: hypothetical protein VKY81_06690 [Natronosporangium sp.]|nr:hypothetical protein [Natronosporangium sp.]
MVTLREVFEELAGGGHPDPAAVLRAHGFDLPDAELRHALVTYAHSAPLEVAGHLRPYVVANSPVSWEETPQPASLADGLELLATAPPPGAESGDPTTDLDGMPGIPAAAGGAMTAAGTKVAADRPDVGTDPAADRLDFGGGADAGVESTGGSAPLDRTGDPWEPVDVELFGIDAVGGEPFDAEPAPEPPGDEDEGDADGIDLIGP